MRVVFEEAVRCLERGERCVLTTVVRTKGSTPQKPGARLLVRQDGSAVGTLGGGCVEGDIWFAAKVLLREGGGPQVRDYVLNEELAARDGLVCGGTMYFLLEPLLEPQVFLPTARAIVEAYRGGPPVALASLLTPPQGSSLAPGSRLLIRHDGSAQGTLGSPALDALALARAPQLMRYGETAYIATEDGVEIFVEGFTSPPCLVVCGGGHISKALYTLATFLGFRFIVIDDRPEYANKERFPLAEQTIVARYDQGLAQVPINANTAVIVATRGHRWDDMALEAAVRSPAGYVGLVGSRRKTILIYEELLRKGIPEERLREVHAPVGLDIGARTPEEIALSIMAEVLMVRTRTTGQPMRLEERLLQKAKERALAQARG
ncbi:MAG: XdhC family protein [Dehalococcoidia bacterium]|nr:XdhC family protein [Dehalococcoidia bacterium]MDW8120455.1 XdhC family protein [Chloroflexota bacterium]